LLEKCDGRAHNTPEVARTIDLKRGKKPVPGKTPRPAMKVTGRRTDNQPEAVRTSVDLTKRRAVPRAASCIWGKICDGRADNQPEAARTIVSNRERSTVPSDFFRPAMKVTGRRADNQPEAARTSVFPPACRAVPRAARRIEENVPNPGTWARAAGATHGWTASSAGVGGVNNIAAVGCGGG
jgi:hypothetical protein